MRKLFIIGNGFDLAHDLPTRYSDFHNYLQETYPGANEDNESVPGFSIGNHGDVQFCAEEVAGYLMNRISHSSNEKWSDFEEALGRLDFDDAFFSLSEGLDEEGDPNPWHTAYNNEDMASTLADCVPMLKGFFSDWINTIQLNHTSGIWGFASLITPNQDLFLNFNYTRTLEMVYGAKHVCHIHGAQGGDILVGHGDEGALFDENHFSSYIGCEDGLEQLHNVFRKDTEGALRTHQPFFRSLTADISSIYSYGFSFSKVDEVYIREICARLDTSGMIWYLNSHNPSEHDRFKDTIQRCGFRGFFDIFST